MLPFASSPPNSSDMFSFLLCGCGVWVWVSGCRCGWMGGYVWVWVCGSRCGWMCVCLDVCVSACVCVMGGCAVLSIFLLPFYFPWQFSLFLVSFYVWHFPSSFLLHLRLRCLPLLFFSLCYFLFFTLLFYYPPASCVALFSHTRLPLLPHTSELSWVLSLFFCFLAPETAQGHTKKER